MNVSLHSLLLLTLKHITCQKRDKFLLLTVRYSTTRYRAIGLPQILQLRDFICSKKMRHFRHKRSSVRSAAIRDLLFTTSHSLKRK